MDASTARVKSAGAPVDIFQGFDDAERASTSTACQRPSGRRCWSPMRTGLLRALDWEDYEPRMEQLLRLHYGAVNLKNARAPRELRAALTGYFKGDLDRLAAIEWRVAGTPFQQKVWNALPGIPAGTTLSYGALAAKLRMPRAVRAVGHANGSNPISVVLPCHRLIGANGSLVKYGGGLERKRWLLQARGRSDSGKGAGRSSGWKLRLRTRAS